MTLCHLLTSPRHASACAAIVFTASVITPLAPADAQARASRPQPAADLQPVRLANVATIRVRDTVPERATPREAIDAATREYRESGIARAVPLGNFVAFPFGHTHPVLTCTVLRVCVIELQGGEAVVNEPIAGDQARWIIQPAQAGPEGQNTLIVVKPKECDITTNLVVPTDRRIYDLTLDSPPCARRSTNPQQKYVRHVRFYYPDDDSASVVASGFNGSPAGRAARVPGAAYDTASEGTLNRAYGVKRERRGPWGLFGRKPLDFPWQPAEMYDDGAHVYITLPREARHHAAPVLYALEDDGTRTMVNYTLDDSTYITDRVFRRAVVVLASGGRERRLEIENRAWGKASAEAEADTLLPDGEGH